MRLVADDLKELEDGSLEVTITFNPFEHGHYMGGARNYNPQKYKAMIENKKTQLHIDNGYALGGYTHDVRTKSGQIKSFMENGEPIIPCCKTVSMEWVNRGSGKGFVRHTQRIADNKIGREVQKLIKAGIGGFSSVHNLQSGDFFGFDYVIYPNFTTNRAIVDNTCKNGMCSITRDSIEVSLERDLRDNVKTYLKHNGMPYSDDIVSSIENLEKHTTTYADNIMLLEEIEKTKQEQNEKIAQKDEALYSFIDTKYKTLLAQLDSLGFDVVDDEVIPTEKVLGGLFKKANLDDALEIDFDKIEPLKLGVKKA